MANRTLKAIRNDAPEPDRNDPALALNQPRWASRPDGSRYVRIYLYPRTLNELRDYSRSFGKAVVMEAEWGAVGVWLMNQPPEADLSNLCRAALRAVPLVRDFDRYRLSLPAHDGRDRPSPALFALSYPEQDEALRVAADTMWDWRREGQPHLGPDRIKAVYQNLVTSPAFIARYIKEQE